MEKRGQVPFLGLFLGFSVDLSPNSSAVLESQESFPLSDYNINNYFKKGT